MFEVETEFKYEDFKKLQNTLFMRKLYGVLVVILVGLVFIIQSQNTYFYITYAIIVTIAILANLITRAYRLKNDWKWGNKTESVKSKFVFEKDHFEEKNDIRESFVYYKDIYRIVETKTEMYIGTSVHRWHIIKKDNCSEELLQFIRKYKQYV